MQNNLYKKVSFVCVVGRAVLYCDRCGLAVWPYITGRSKAVLYGEYSTGGAFESPAQSTILYALSAVLNLDIKEKQVLYFSY